MTTPLAGRAALITGAASGIGRASAIVLAKSGAFVCVHYHTSSDAAKQTLHDIEQAGGAGMTLQADLSIEEEATRLVDQFVERAGRLDVLVNNAGTPLERRKLEECPTALWKQAFDVNVHGAFFVTRRAIPHLRKSAMERPSGTSSIINNLSLSVQTGGAGGAGPYAAAKGALQVMTRTLARELAPVIRVNAIMPGVIETRHHEVFSTAEGMERYRSETALKRNGLPGEVGEVVLFLASDASSFMSGALLDINGGRFLR